MSSWDLLVQMGMACALGVLLGGTIGYYAAAGDAERKLKALNDKINALR